VVIAGAMDYGDDREQWPKNQGLGDPAFPEHGGFGF